MNDFANGFLKGYKAAIEDAVPGFFANMVTYEGFAYSGVLRWFIDHIKMVDINEEGEYYEVTMKEYLETCLEDWLVSHYAEIERDFQEQEWFEEEHESEEDYGECQKCVHGVPKNEEQYFCAFHGMNMNKSNTCEDYIERLKMEGP